MKKKTKIILTVFFITFVSIALAVTNVIRLKNKLIGNINDVVTNELKSYTIGDFVNFDPVNYEICDEDQTSVTCYRWMVVNKNDNNYDLFLLNSIDSFKWTSNNPATTISNATSNWSDKLTVDSSYDITVNDSFILNFSSTKARLLLKSEYDNLPSNSKDALTNYCNNTRYIVKENGNTICGILDPVTSFSGMISSTGYGNGFPFISMPTGAMYGNNFTARPVVNITMNDDMGNRYKIIKKVYDPGDIVYFDPVTEDECNSTTYDEAKVNKKETTCYRWRVITSDDDTRKKKVNIQLDHNIANYRWNELNDLTAEENNRICAPDENNHCTNADYYSEGTEETHITNQSIGPRAVLTKLAEVTSTWERVPLLNYEYDTTDIVPKEEWNLVYRDRFNYGLLKCTDGTCTTSKFDLTMATGLRARMITVDEIVDIIKRELPDLEPVETYYSPEILNVWTHGSGMTYDKNSGKYYFSNSSNPVESKKLSWLLENTSSYAFGDGASGATGYGSNTAVPIIHNSYYTITPISDGYMYCYVWNVYEDGYVGYTSTNLSYDGIRPVIEYDKEYINVTVTYNDEDRITEREIQSGSTAEEIDSQGKEGYSFKYWSLDRTNEYDFSSPVTEDITLYAVYEINKYNVEFYDEGAKIDTVEVNWNNKVNQSNIPVVSKEGYDFVGWTEENNQELFNFDTLITKNYKLYSSYLKQEEEEKEECSLSISSDKYDIDLNNKTINNVPEKETIEDIEKNITIVAEEKQITSEYITIICDDKIETYKINRIRILSTGQLRTRYGILLVLLTFIVTLLVVSDKKRIALKNMINK